MKKILLIFLCLLFIISDLSAVSAPDRGIYGSLSFLYWEEDVISGNSKYTQADFAQEYKLGYKGNIYSPKLLDYTLEGSIRYEDLESESDTTTTKSTSDSKNYRMNFMFIKGTSFPFTLYTNKGENPMTRIDSTSTFSYLYKTREKGLNGSLIFDIFTINYGASQSKNTSETLTSVQDSDTNTHYAGIRRNSKNYNFSMNYKHFEQKVNTEDALIDITSLDRYNTAQLDDSIDIRYKYNISDTLTFNSDASYLESDFMSLYSETTTSNVDLRWVPTPKINASIRLSGTKLDTVYDVNENNTTIGVFNTYSIYQNLNYQISPTLSFTQSYSHYIYENKVVEGIIANYRSALRHSYKNKLSTDTTMRIYTNIDAQKTDTTTVAQDANDSSSSVNRYSLLVNGNIIEQLPLLSSRMRVNVDYYNMQTSAKESEERYGTDLSLLTNFLYIFRNNLTLSYLETDRTSLRYSTLTQQYATAQSTTSSMELSEALDFSLRLGINGRMSFLAGLRYSNIRSNGSSSSRMQPLVDIKLNYRLGRNLTFNANAHVDRDLTYDYTNYRGESGLIYRVGKTSLSFDYRYSRTDYEDNTISRDYGRSRFDTKLIRKF